MGPSRKILFSSFAVFILLFGTILPICNALGEELDFGNEDPVCELSCDGMETKYYTKVGDAVSYWNANCLENKDCTITLYANQTITEDPIEIHQSGTTTRTLTIVAQEKVVMKCSGVPVVDYDGDENPCVFYITAESDFSQTPSLTIKNITFDMSDRTDGNACYAIYSSGAGEERYIRGVLVDTCKFIGSTKVDCVAVKNLRNGAADFTILNCVSENMHSLFNGYCYNRENEKKGMKGLNIIGCTFTNGKYFVNNSAESHSTLIQNCVASFTGGSKDTYGVRFRGEALYMDNVSLIYTGSESETAFAAFVVPKGNNPVTNLELNNCSFTGMYVDDYLTQPHRKDIFIDGTKSGGIGGFKIDGQSVTWETTKKYYNFPRYTVTVGDATGGTAKVSDGHKEGSQIQAMKGARLTLSYELSDDYILDHWETTPSLTIDANNKFVMVGENVTINPVFKEVTDTCDITVKRYVDEAYSGETTTTVEPNSEFKLIAAEDNFRVVNVIIDEEEMGPIGMYTLIVEDDLQIEVYLESSPGTQVIIGDDSITEITEETLEGTRGKILTVTTFEDGEIEKTVVISNVDNTIYTEGRETEEGTTVITVINAETASGEGADIAELTANDVEEIAIQKAFAFEEISSEDAVIEVEVDTESGDFDKTSVQMGYDVLDSIKDFTLTIKTDDGTIVVGSDVLNNLAEEAEEDSQTLILTVGLADDVTEREKELFGDSTVISAEAILTKNGVPRTIHDLGGDVVVQMQCEPKEEESYDKVTVYYYDETTGKLEKFNATYDPETKMVSFVTGHFSHFAVIFGELPEDNVVTSVTLMPLVMFLLFGLFFIFIVARNRRDDDDE